jgi:Domain of unknown function (DUF4190)
MAPPLPPDEPTRDMSSPDDDAVWRRDPGQSGGPPTLPDPMLPAPTRPGPAVPRPALPERFVPGRAQPAPIEPAVSGLPVTSPYPQPVYPSGAPYGGYAYPVAAQATNGMAIASLVCSIVGLVSCFLLCIVGAILGHVAQGQIRQTGEGGDGLAKAGIIIGWIGTGLVLLCCGGYVLFFGGLGLIGSTVPNQ